MRLKYAMVFFMMVMFIASCHNDPKIDPKKKDKDKGGSYSQLILESKKA